MKGIETSTPVLTEGANSTRAPEQVLTLAGAEDVALAEAASGGSGVHDNALRKHPLALAERDSALKTLRRKRVSVDHVHLSQYDGTDLVQWLGRFADGWHRPLGRLMKIVTVAPDQRPSTEGRTTGTEPLVPNPAIEEAESE